MKSGKGKGRGGCRGLAKRRRGNGGGCEIGLDCRQSDRERQARRSGLISLQGSTEKRVNGVAPLRHTAGTVLGVWVRVCACASLASPPRFLAGRIQTFCRGRTRRRVLAQPDLVVLTDNGHRPRHLLSLLSARFHSQAQGDRHRQRQRQTQRGEQGGHWHSGTCRRSNPSFFFLLPRLQLMGTTSVLVLRIEQPIMHCG